MYSSTYLKSLQHKSKSLDLPPNTKIPAIGFRYTPKKRAKSQPPSPKVDLNSLKKIKDYLVVKKTNILHEKEIHTIDSKKEIKVSDDGLSLEKGTGKFLHQVSYCSFLCGKIQGSHSLLY